MMNDAANPHDNKMSDIMKFPNLKEFYGKAMYVWRVSRRPSDKELMENFKVVMAGVLVMGFIGFFISVIFGFIQKK